MHRAAHLQFDRIVQEYERWRAVSDDERSPSPAWWWGPAFEVIGLKTPLPAASCISLGLSAGATYADGAEVFLKSFAGQASLPWPDDFPRRPEHRDSN